jgi:hypothetical protein
VNKRYKNKMLSSFLRFRQAPPIEKESVKIILCVFLVGVLSAQRFWLPLTSAFICVAFIIIPIIYGLKHKYSFVVPILSLVSMNDLGGGSYEETPFAIKYLLYLVAIFYGFALRRYKRNGFEVYILGCAVAIIFNTIFHEHELDGYTLVRDVLTVGLVVGVVFMDTNDIIDGVSLDLIFSFALGVVVSECFNIATVFNNSYGSYLNYSSSKYIVVLPLLYCVIKNYFIWSLILFPLTAIVEIQYSSKMLMLTSCLVLACLLIRNLSHRKIKSVLFVILTGSAAVAVGKLLLNLFEANRIFASFSDLNQFSTFEGSLEGLDAVRAAETKYLLNQSFYQLLFGNGLGTGIFDSSGLFSMAFNDGSAFSIEERNQSHYFRLHDSWSWFGLRFGLIAYAGVFIWCAKGVFHRSSNVALTASILVLAFMNSTFSINGLIGCAILAVHYKKLKSNFMKDVQNPN